MTDEQVPEVAPEAEAEAPAPDETPVKPAKAFKAPVVVPRCPFCGLAFGTCSHPTGVNPV